MDETEHQEAAHVEDFREIMRKHIEELKAERSEEDRIWGLVKNGEAKISTEDDANLIGKLLIEAQEEIGRVAALADARVKRAESKLEKLRFIFEAALADWTTRRLDGKKTRSVILDDVMLGTRKLPAKVITENQEELKKFCETELLDAVEYVPKISLDIVKDWEKKNDKLAPGRHQVPEGSAFYYKIPKRTEDANGENAGANENRSA